MLGFNFFPLSLIHHFVVGAMFQILMDTCDIMYSSVHGYKVACWCIQDDEVDRPTMGQLVQILEGPVEITMPPVPRLLQAMAGSAHSTCSFFVSGKRAAKAAGSDMVRGTQAVILAQ